jgi:hypothetical protein
MWVGANEFLGVEVAVEYVGCGVGWNQSLAWLYELIEFISGDDVDETFEGAGV